MSIKQIYHVTSLTGGVDSTYLDYADGNSLSDKDRAFAIVSGVVYLYELNATSGAAESSPNVISPDTNAGTKRWILIGQNLAGLTFTAAAVGFTIAGGTTSKTLTVTADTSLDEAVAMSSKAPKASPTFTTQITTPIVYGGSAANDDITIEGTSHATKATSYVILQPTSGNVGIGTTNSGASLQVAGTGIWSSVYGFAAGGNAPLTYASAALRMGNDWRIMDDGAFKINQSGAAAFLTILNTGNVGIGTTAPASPLAVNRQSDDGVVIDIEQADTVEGTISVSGTTVSYNAFVGSHYTQLKDGQTEPPVGAVVISLGEIIPCEVTIEKDETTEEEIRKEDAFEEVVTEAKPEVKEEKYVLNGKDIVTAEVVSSPAIEAKTEQKLKAGVTFDEKTGTFRKSTTVKVPVSKDVSSKEYFTYVDSTVKPADKRVYGTWFGKMSNDAKGQSFGQDAKAIYLVAQVGLFKIRVTDTNGDIENGDYLETSKRPYEAQKQTVGAKINSTIAKAIIDVKWVNVPVDKKLGYKWRLIPCVF